MLSLLLQTLEAYFATGEVATEAARRLNMSVRTVTYRLDKVKTLTGHDPGDPAQRFTCTSPSSARACSSGLHVTSIGRGHPGLADATSRHPTDHRCRASANTAARFADRRRTCPRRAATES